MVREGLSCLSVVLDSVCTLAVFTPILVQLGSRPLPSSEMARLVGEWWLFRLRLPLRPPRPRSGDGGRIPPRPAGGEQPKVEASFERTSSWRPTLPSCAGSPRSRRTAPPSSFLPSPSSRRRGPPSAATTFPLPETLYLEHLARHVRPGDGVGALLLAAPLLFAASPSHRITMGTLVQLSNSFDKVFSSLSIISENWGEINAFRSVLFRLREFEKKLYGEGGGDGSSGGTCLVPSGAERSDDAAEEEEERRPNSRASARLPPPVPPPAPSSLLPHRHVRRDDAGRGRVQVEERESTFLPPTSDLQRSTSTRRLRPPSSVPVGFPTSTTGASEGVGWR